MEFAAFVEKPHLRKFILRDFSPPNYLITLYLFHPDIITNMKLDGGRQFVSDKLGTELIRCLCHFPWLSCEEKRIWTYLS